MPDILRRSPDAEFILESGEKNWDWREITVPVAMVQPDAVVSSRSEAVDVYCALFDGSRNEYEYERWDRIEAWAGPLGPQEALRQAPPLFNLAADGRVTLLDGWHRLAWASSHGAETVTVLIGAGTINHDDE